MIIYIIKSTLALGLFYGMYHFLLSKESLFKFNRFYFQIFDPVEKYSNVGEKSSENR